MTLEAVAGALVALLSMLILWLFSIVIGDRAPAPVMGGVCTEGDFRYAMSTAQEGHRTEAKVMSIFNCFCRSGKFVEVFGDDGQLPWLSRPATSFEQQKSRGLKTVGLDFDGWNADLKIAFEYNGRNHYELIYGSGPKQVQKLQKTARNGETKIRLARENGVNLIVIPYTVPGSALENYIKSRLYDAHALAEGTQYEYLGPTPEPAVNYGRALPTLVINTTAKVAPPPTRVWSPVAESAVNAPVFAPRSSAKNVIDLTSEAPINKSVSPPVIDLTL